VATISVRGSNLPGIAEDDAMTRLQRRCIRDLRNVAAVDASARGFVITAPELEWAQLYNRVLATIRAEFHVEAATGRWPTPENWFQLG
jgi:hypothetical protein